MDSDRESGERTPTEKEPLTGYAHVYAAISAIVNEDLEFFTPPELIDASEAGLPNVEEEGGEDLSPTTHLLQQACQVFQISPRAEDSPAHVIETLTKDVIRPR